MESSYKKQDERFYDDKIRRKRSYYWDTAIGLNKVDGLNPSVYLLELKEDSIQGRKSYEVIEKELRNYYSRQELTSETAGTRECDIVATRIAKILDSRDFVFSPIMLLNIHKRLFDGLFSGKLAGYEGRFRDYNIEKAEPVLGGESVRYGDYLSLEDYLRYDFDTEKVKNYAAMSPSDTAASMARFVSSIWQVHPFVEGNTRATAVFLKKYMLSLGYSNVDNTLSKDNSVYFRNALVASNYTDAARGIGPSFKYIESFLLNLIEKKERPLPRIILTLKKTRDDDLER